MPRIIRRHILATLICLSFWLLICSSAAQGAIIINAPMTDTNSSGWVLGGNPNSALLTGNGSIDASGSGWLRLTNNTGDQTGFAYNTTSFDLSAGVLIQFDYATWGGSGADGYSVYLFDANVPTFNIGAFGGSLGYAQKSASATCSPAPANVPGISGGYVGIGVDEFGNFAYGCEGRRNGTSQKPNTVTVRGSVVGFGGGAVGSTQATTSYPWIYTSGTSATSLWYNGTPRPNQFGTDYRKVIIRVSPAPNPVADVWIQYGYNTTPVQMVAGQALPAISASQQLKIGYAASTGGSTNYHEIRNLLITTLNQSSAIDLGVTKTAVATGTSTAITSALVGNSFDYLITARNYGPNNVTATGVGIVDNFPASLTPGAWSCSASGGASCGAASGSGSLNTSANLPLNGAVTYRVAATVNAMPAGNLLSNTASLSIPGAVTDYFPNNNSVTTSINAYARPTVTKTLSPAAVPLNTNSALTITLTNPNSIAATGVAFTDSYPTVPAGLVNAAAAATPQCGGTVTAASGGTSLALSGGTIPANGSCTVTVNVKSASTGTFTNTLASGAVSTTNIGTNAAAASGVLTVLAAPTLTKTLVPATIALGDTSVLTVAIGNTNASAITLTSALTDSFPAGMVVQGSAGNTGTCPGVTAAAGAGSFSIANGSSVPAGGCTVIVNVTGTTTGLKTNTIAAGALTTSAGNNSAAVSAGLTVTSAATLAKAYSAGTVAAGSSSTLSFSIVNGTGNPAQSNLAFTDTFPAGLTVTGVGTVTGTGCSGTPSFTASSVTLTGGAISAGNAGPCSFSATVQGNAGGSYPNGSAQLSGQGGGLITSAASATLNVYLPPTATKSFSPTSITLGGTTVLALTIANPAANPGALTSNLLSDSFPSGLALKDTTFTFTPAACGTVSKILGGASAAGDTGVLLSAATLAAGASCQVQMNVTSTLANNFVNSTGAPTAAGPVALTGTAATASLNGTQAPTVTKAFAAPNIVSGGNTNLTVTLSNTNASAISLTAPFSDSFPSGMTVNGNAGNTGTCPGVSAPAGAGSFTMANGSSIPAGGCTIIVNVTSATAGSAVDSIPAGALQTTVGSNAAPASATLKVFLPPTVTKSFTPPGVSYGGSSVLTITVTNPAANPDNLTGVSIADSFTGTLKNAAAGSVACTGAGLATLTGGALNGVAVGFNAGTVVPGGSCTITQSVSATSSNSNVTGAAAAAGPVALTGTTGSATLTVTPIAPTVSKAFASSTIASGGNTNLTVTLGNDNAGPITLTSALTDSFPSGLTIGSAGNTGSCAGVTATAGAGSFTMASGSSIPAGGCTIIVNVKSSTAGAALNSIAAGALQTAAGSNASAASDTLNVYAAPTVVKTFTPAGISSGGASSLTITVTNPAANPGDLTGVSIADSYTGTLTNNAAGSVSCTGAGSATLTGGALNGVAVGFNAGSIPPGGSCTVTQGVSATSSNTNTTGAPTATGPVALTGTSGSATLTTTLLPAPTVLKSFGATQIATGGTAALTIKLSNASSIDIIGAAFSDVLPTSPGQMSIAPSAVLSNSCGGTGTIAADKKSFSISGGTIPANSFCTVSVSVTATTLGLYTNTTSTVTSTNATTSATASASITVALLASPTVVKSFSPNQVGINGTSVLSVTLTNPNSTAITGASFTDSYPSVSGTFLRNTATPAGAISCTGVGGGGTVTAGANLSSLALSGGTIPANSSCTITVNVSAAAAGSYLNSTGAVSTTNASTGTSASATLDVLQPMTAIKAFTPATILPGGTSTLSVTLTNPNAIAITGVQFTDSYPTSPGSLINAALPAWTLAGCTGTVTAASGGPSLAFTGGSIPGNTTCTLTVKVTAPALGSYSNSIATIASTDAGSIGPVSGTLAVMNAPTVTKSFGVANLARGGNTSLTVTLGNSNAVPITLTSALTDSFPSGMTINTAGNTGSCPGVSATAGSGSFSIASGTAIPAGGCTVIVNVSAATAGLATNTIAAGALQTNAGNNASAASAGLNVYAPPTLAKTFGAATIPAGAATTLVLTLANPSANLAALTGVQLDDFFPGGLTLQNTTFSFAPSACGSVTKTTGLASAAGDGSLRFSVATLAPGVSCQATVNVTSSTGGGITNTTNAPTAAGPTALSGSAASAALNIVAQPLISILKSANLASANPGQTVTYTVQLVNTGTGAGTSVVLTDDMSPYGAFFLNGGSPFAVTDSSPASGLTLGAVQYSKDGGATWGASAVATVGGPLNGCDPAITNWRIPMTGSIRAGGSYQLQYQVVVK
jgi:uncharacterized repeat protein (TIGR01451 family)